jgi:hypothetical protein
MSANPSKVYCVSIYQLKNNFNSGTIKKLFANNANYDDDNRRGPKHIGIVEAVRFEYDRPKGYKSADVYYRIDYSNPVTAECGERFVRDTEDYELSVLYNVGECNWVLFKRHDRMPIIAPERFETKCAEPYWEEEDDSDDEETHYFEYKYLKRHLPAGWLIV